jgi:hypothetical protein
MEEMLLFFRGMLVFFAMAVWFSLGMLCCMCIDYLVLRLLGIDHTRHRYPGIILKTLMTVGAYGLFLRDIKIEKGDDRL